jgi:hypothetical protein
MSSRRQITAGAACLLAGSLLAAGCSGSRGRSAPVPRRVPPNAAAIIGATPVTTVNVVHWLAIIERGQAASGPIAGTHRRAIAATVAFLVKAQWLLQESRAEGINESVLNQVVAQRTAQAQPQRGMTRADASFQARLDVIAEALQHHNDRAAPVTHAQVAAYYSRHRSQFIEPGVRDTLMVLTHTRSAALAARAALVRGTSWAVVAKRWSEDSSTLTGGAYNIVAGVQAPRLVRAAFMARPQLLVGPIGMPPGSGQPGPTYYLFKVTGGHPASQQPLSKVAAQVSQTLTEQERRSSFTAFTRSYEQRWRSRTLCAALPGG